MSDLFDQLSQFAKRGVAAQRAADGIISQPLAHTGDPATSYEAATKMVESGALSRQEDEVWQAISESIFRRWDYEDFTARELSNWSGLNYFFIQRRLSGLRNHGKIERISVNNNRKPPWVKRDGCCVWRIK